MERTLIVSAVLCGMMLATLAVHVPDTGYSSNDHKPPSGYSDHPPSGYSNHPSSGYGSHPSSGYGSHPSSGYGSPSGSSYGSYSGSGYGSHSGSGYEASFSYARLEQMDRWIHRVSAEKIQVKNKVEMLKMQKSDLLARLHWILKTTIPEFNAVQSSQDAKLNFIKRYIKDVLHRLGDKEADLAGETKISQRYHDALDDSWRRIYELIANNDEQDALIAKIELALIEAQEKLNKKLDARTEEAEGKVVELEYNAKAAIDLFNTRKCYSASIHVKMNDTGTVTFPPGFFKGMTPTAFCSLTGFTSHLTLGSHSVPGYGPSYGDDDYQVLAVTVDCKPFDSYVQVFVKDGSRGGYNSVDGVYVDVKACTLGPQALAPHGFPIVSDSK